MEGRSRMNTRQVKRSLTGGLGLAVAIATFAAAPPAIADTSQVGSTTAVGGSTVLGQQPTLRVDQTGPDSAMMSVPGGSFHPAPDGSVTVERADGSTAFRLRTSGTSATGESVSLTYAAVGGRLSVKWVVGTTTGGVTVDGFNLGCALALAGLALGTAGVIVATAGTAAAFGFAGASYVISVGGVLTGCY